MNITSIFRGTVNQLTTGAGKVISNVVDFFSSLRSGITGLFNSSTPFRQATTEPSFIHHTSIGFGSNDRISEKSSLNTLRDFLGEKCGVNTTEGRVNGEKDNIENNIYEEKNNKEDPIYEEINENILDLIRKLPESRNENKSSVIEDEYSIVVDSIEESSENIYSEPYEAALSDGNKYNTI
ncbi:TPA: hypothetical protein SMN35_001951 [Proteus mirabilis]